MSFAALHDQRHSAARVGRISLDSPLGAALLGRRKDESLNCGDVFGVSERKVDQMINQIPAGWVAVARDTFEYNMRPWVGVRHEQWLRDSLRSHPVDPRGQVLVPSQIHESFKKRRHFTPATAGELAAAGYPKLPREPLPEATSRVVPWPSVQPAAETPAIAQPAAA